MRLDIADLRLFLDLVGLATICDVVPLKDVNRAFVRFGLSQIGMPSLIPRELFAWIGALIVGGTAWAHMTVCADPLALRTDGAAQDGLSQF